MEGLFAALVVGALFPLGDAPPLQPLHPPAPRAEHCFVAEYCQTEPCVQFVAAAEALRALPVEGTAADPDQLAALARLRLFERVPPASRQSVASLICQLDAERDHQRSVTISGPAPSSAS